MCILALFVCGLKTNEMENVQVLFAEDDALTRMEVKERMEAKGWRVIEAEDGIKAFDRYEEYKPDLVILDVAMPGRTGLEVLQLIRTRDQDTPVIIYSSLGAEKDLLAGFRCGAKVYLVKNYSVAVLVAQVETLLRKKEEVDVLFLAEGVTYAVSSSVLTVGGESVQLTKLESKVFTVLCKNPNQLIKRDLLLKAGWDSDEFRFELQLNKVIRRLRALLASATSIEIVTDKGNGYWFMCSK